MQSSSFEWDARKDQANREKHGIGFLDAAGAFLDERRIVAEDLTHSTAKEGRYYCFGSYGGGILTVRFTYRDGVIRIFGAGYWRKANVSMTKPIKYTKGPIGAVKIVEDFLPPPSQLVVKEDMEKVTIALSKRSVDFFRKEAKKHGIQYQRMIRALVDQYAQHNAPPNNRMQRSGSR
jgi:uncharacterized DUF497 family protein